MTDTETEVYHYAACKDCNRYKWVGSKTEALHSAQFHEMENDHTAYTGQVPKSAVSRNLEGGGFDG